MSVLTARLLFLLVFIKKSFAGDNSTSRYVNLTADFTLCEKCISKCCHFGEYVNKTKCVSYAEDLQLPMYPVYTEDIKNTGKVLNDYFSIIPGKFYDGTFKLNAINRYQLGFKHYITENRTLYLELPNAYERWTKVPPSNYCIDYLLHKHLKTPEVRVWITLEPGQTVESKNFMKLGFMISCMFFIIVLFVYSVLPELRNLCGMILMAYVSSLLSSYLLLFVTWNLGSINKRTCIRIAAPLYLSFMASFCWMNIMSCDIWWTFRGYAKARPIHRRGESFKFCMYSLYGWGVPLGMTIFFVVANESHLTDYPWFITPMIPVRGCFLKSGQKLLYMYVPMLIMSFLNWTFYLMTALNIWRLSRGTAVLDSAAAGTPAAHRSLKHRFFVYIKLSVLMGLNWILEVLSSFNPDLKIWWVTDAYNLFIGAAIFFMFVCKKKIYKKLIKMGVGIVSRIKGQHRWTPNSKSRSNFTTDSNTQDSNSKSQDIPLQICVNPRDIQG